MAETILSVDIGTSSLKAALIDLNGGLRASSRIAYAAGPEGNVGADSWERAFALALEELRSLAPGRGIDGICISGNGPTLVPVTADGGALPPLYWHGNRAAPPGGNRAPSFFLPHAAWLKEYAPGEYGKTSLFMSSHEWLAYRLGAEAFTALPQEAYRPYYWDDEQCRLFTLDSDKFPPFVKMGTVVGRVCPGAAALSGSIRGNCLASGIPIVAGGPDFITALLGTGTLRPGDVCDRAGSSEGINVCAASPVDGNGLRVLPHAKEGLWNIGALIPSSGRLFEDYRSLTGQQGRSYGEQLAELIPSTNNIDVFRDITPHSSFLTPHSSFSPPHSSLASGRSLLCAMGFAVRSAADTLAARGFPVREMRVSGGQARNSRWNRLKADITGISLMVPEIPDGELAGNAVLAAAALGSGAVSAERIVRFPNIYEPSADTAAFWEERYLLYLGKPETGNPG